MSLRAMDQAAVNACFGESYADARDRFRAAVAGLGVKVDVRVNPNAEGPAGERLSTDVARIGPARAARVLFVTSATHGGEGFCGSGGQVAMIRSGLFDALPPDTAVVLVHAINPYGFAHISRTTEDNVDLNRNFVDFSKPLPVNAAYEDVHPFMLPSDWDGKARWAAEEAIARYIAEKGMWTFQCAVSGGQYAHADGLFYGGDQPTWSNATFREIIAEHGAAASHVALFDYHTGLGPYGYGEPIVTGTQEEKDRARRWYGNEATDPEAGSSTSAPIRGTMSSAFAGAAPQAKMAAVSVEYGTVPVPDVLTALRADNWLRFRGDPRSGLARTIKRRMRDAFYCDFDDWRRMVVTRGLEIGRKALDGLACEA